MRIQARHTPDALCSHARRGTSVRSSSPATANGTDCRMTLSVLSIARVFLNRTISFEPARACSESLHCVVVVGHVCPFERLLACTCNHRFLLYPYNDGPRRPTRGSTRREAEYRARRPSRLDLSKTRGVTPLASRTSNAGQRRAALPHARDYLSRVNL